MHVLTVTSWKDKPQFLLQIISISKYLQGNFKHFIIINDVPILTTKKFIKSWHRLVESVYKDCIPFEIIVGKWNKEWGECDHGWQSQQIHKLYYYENIGEDYVVLDSKNFFIRETLISDFEEMLGSGVREQCYWQFVDINDQYAKHFNVTAMHDPINPVTPFVIKHEILKKYGDKNSIASILTSLKSQSGAWPSEFLWYNYLIKDRLGDITQHVKMYGVYDVKYFNNSVCVIKDDKRIKVLSIHRKIIKELKNTKNFIQRRNFRSLLKYFELPTLDGILKTHKKNS